MALRKRILHKKMITGRKNMRPVGPLFIFVLCSLLVTGCGNIDRDAVVVKSYGNLSNAYDDTMETIPVEDYVKDYYENFEWDRNLAFDGLKETITHVNDDNTSYDVHASVDKNNNFMVRIYGEDKQHVTMSGEVKVIGNKSYLKVSSNNMEKDTYFTAPYNAANTNLAAGIYLEVFDLAKSIQVTEPDNHNVKITYNCRTKLDNKLVDNITVLFYDDPNYTYVLFVDVDTKKVVRISSSIVSGNDVTDLVYAENTDIDPYTESELKNSTNGEATKVDDAEISRLFDIICYGIYNKDMESEVNKDVE